MNKLFQNDLDELDNLLERVKIQCTNYIKNINERPTSTQNKIELTSTLPEIGLGTIDALQKFNS